MKNLAKIGIVGLILLIGLGMVLLVACETDLSEAAGDEQVDSIETERFGTSSGRYLGWRAIDREAGVVCYFNFSGGGDCFLISDTSLRIGE